MKDGEQLSPEVIYRLMADVGFRRHFHTGGMEATKELIDLCQIDTDKHVLDVGCASGKTACYVASRYGCRVVGVDILERMIDRSHERAKRERVEDRVAFRVADAKSLPFDNDQFDVVIGEFITGLLDDKPKGVNEYLRVTKPGGYVGLNEGTWIKTPAPRELVDYLSVTFGLPESPLTSEEWKQLLAGAGLRDVAASTYKADALGSGREGLKDLLFVWHRVLYLYIRSSAFRSFTRETLSLPKNLLKYFGYGIYVGRK